MDQAQASVTPVLSVIAPCYNEARNLPELVARLEGAFDRKGIDGEIILVDDGSTDDTTAVLDGLTAAHPRLRTIRHDRNRGIAAAWRSGLEAARGALVCLIDADLQNPPEDVPRLLRELRQSGADVVQGWRSNIGRLFDHRWVLSKGLNLLLNILFGMRARDNKSGFVMARREVMADVLTHRYRYRYYQSFITVAAASKGYTIREVETLFDRRRVGSSFIAGFPVAVVLWSLLDLAKAVGEFRLSPKREGAVGDFLRDHPPSRRSPPLTGWRAWSMRAFFATMPLHHWMITRQARHYYDELLRSQWLSLADMRALQERKLRRLIGHAYHHVAYWRERMDERGLTPDDFRTLEDLAKLPLLSKEALREHLYFDLLSDNHDKRRIQRVTTSGSTGEPLTVYVDQHQLEIRWANTQRSMEWTGYRFGDRSARLWHQTIGMTWSQIARERLDAWWNRRLFVPAFEMDEAGIARAVAHLRRHRPVLIDGYAESFNFLAHYARQRGLEGIRPRGIISSAQELPDHSRAVIADTFACGVYDKYGSREFSGIAWECEAHDGHHVVAESFVVEILKDGRPARPGELGEIVVTDLNNLVMPLIRYRIGDLAVAMDPDVPCACGRGLPRIGRIEGRVQAMIVADNGAYVPGTFFSHLFKDYDHVVRQYQVIQERRGAIRLRIVRGTRFSTEQFDEILALMRRYLGADMQIDVELTERIEMVRTGKHRSTVSALDLDLQSGENVEVLRAP
ncbi:MAG TPA: glycosyltransferase [Candidatus Dormibacteraeota bacterium]|nr:glycosyltransferase [Candidatus Dormibacteraeota bacterium]